MAELHIILSDQPPFPVRVMINGEWVGFIQRLRLEAWASPTQDYQLSLEFPPDDIMQNMSELSHARYELIRGLVAPFLGDPPHPPHPPSPLGPTSWERLSLGLGIPEDE
jgi:hypothetical protein